MLNTIIDIVNKIFINITNITLGICGHDFRKEIKIRAQLLFLCSVVVFSMMKLLCKVKASKTKIKVS